MKKKTYREIESLAELRRNVTLLPEGCHCLERMAFQAIDFSLLDPAHHAADIGFKDCLFLGCRLPEGYERRMVACMVFNEFEKPFKTFPNALYCAETLYEGYDPVREASFANCYDTKVYRHYMQFGKRGSDLAETLARTLHDFSISDALYDLLAKVDERKVVGIMGGHALRRTESAYRNIVQISKSLTEQGYLMISGGGPGAMEATHLGAWLAGRGLAEMEQVMPLLEKAPTFRDKGWLASAFRVMELFPRNPRYISIGIPTWFYGHEPATPFATHIAKYFENSVREDGVLTIAKGGIIYTPGSAGTLQEIFQDSAQNHYLTWGYASPMVFLGKEYYKNELPVYTLLEDLQARGHYKNLTLRIADDPEAVVAAIKKG